MVLLIGCSALLPPAYPRPVSPMPQLANRQIARSLMIDRNLVQRYKSPELATGSSESVATSRVGGDGKVRRMSDESVEDRIMVLLRRSGLAP